MLKARPARKAEDTSTTLCSRARRTEAIEAAAEVLRARFPVTDTSHGSAARRGDPESDIDLLVLTSRPLDNEEQSGMWSHRHEISVPTPSSPATAAACSARGVHSVLLIHAECRARGRVVCRSRRRAAPGRTPPPANEVPLSTPSREALVKHVVDEWMRMADEALASARADVDAWRWRSTINRAYYAAFYVSRPCC